MAVRGWFRRYRRVPAWRPLKGQLWEARQMPDKLPVDEIRFHWGADQRQLPMFALPNREIARRLDEQLGEGMGMGWQWWW